MTRRHPTRGALQGPGAGERGPQETLEDFFATPEELAAGELGLGALGDVRGSEGIGVREYLGFRLANEHFGLEIARIREIIKVPLITRVPRVEPVVLGILSLRGTIVPVVDLRLLLKLQVTPQTRRSRVLIYERLGEAIGLLVDEVHHVVRLGDADIEPHPFGGRPDSEPVVGVGRQDDEILALLDLEAILQLERFIRHAKDRSVLTPEG